MKEVRYLIIALWLGGLCITPLAYCADELTDERAIQAAQEGLKKSAKFPWYDASQDGLRDVRAKERSTDDSATRKDGWQKSAKPTRPPKTPPATLGGTWNWGNWVPASLQTIAITIFVILLLTLIVIAIRYFLQEEDFVLNGSNDPKLASNEAELNSRRVENLPFQAPVEKGDHLSEARRHYEAGNFEAAILYLYAYQLMQLDRQQIIHLTKGKTNRQYLREIPRNSPLRGIVEQSMIAFEDVFFGQHKLSREQFEACWRQIDAFHRYLEQPLNIGLELPSSLAKGGLT